MFSAKKQKSIAGVGGFIMQDGEQWEGKYSGFAQGCACSSFANSFPGDCKGTLAIVIRINPHCAQLEGPKVKVREEATHSTSTVLPEARDPLLLCVLLFQCQQPCAAF